MAMKKKEAIALLGNGKMSEAAKAIGISYNGIYKWPDELTAKIEDRVHAAMLRKRADFKKRKRMDTE